MRDGWAEQRHAAHEGMPSRPWASRRGGLSASLRREPAAAEVLPGVVGRSPAMRAMAELVRRVAPLRVPVMVLGESGAGKELVARALHRYSQRAAGPFVPINGATLTGELAGSELFGHRRGAFTGASADRAGAFRRAKGGTLFLDELAALSLSVQARLLRAVEEAAVLPLGADDPEPVDARLVTATCEPIEALVERRAFRADLYQRLSVCVVRVPPLRERREDIPLVVRALLARLALAGYELGPGVDDELRRHPWPGNVRELGNVLLQAALGSEGSRIELGAVQAVVRDRWGGRGLLEPEGARLLLAESGGNVSAAARRARIPRSTFRDLLRAPPQPS